MSISSFDHPSNCVNLLTIPIVPSKAAFCISNCEILQGIFSKSCLKLFDITPVAPITIGMTRPSLTFHRRFNSIERSMYRVSQKKRGAFGGP